MNPMPLLLALLTLAYIGSLYSKRRVLGSTSGLEFVVLGALLGPNALGTVGSEALLAFDPVALLALGWIGLGFGIEFGINGERRTSAGRFVLGIVLTLLVATGVGASVFWVASQFNWLPTEQVETAAIATALVSAETTRLALRWVAVRHAVYGSLTELLGDLAATDDAPVMIGLVAVFARRSGPLSAFGLSVPTWASTLATLGVGVILGLCCTYLTSRDRSTVHRWIVLLGGAWLATGVTTNLGLSAMGATFAMGLVLSLASPIAPELRAQVMATEGALRLPALLLAGARLELPHAPIEVLLIATALGARWLGSWLIGGVLAASRRSWRPATPWLGIAMTSSGSLTMMVGLACSVALGGDVGRVALSAAASFTFFGELLGPRALVRALVAAGESRATPEPRTAPATAPLGAAP
jgi:hypothetical protein